jgi:ribose-phosphate pyrophosphokinase
MSPRWFSWQTTDMTLKVFALDATRAYGERVAASLGLRLGQLEERSFADGEHKTRPLENVRGGDVYVLHSLYGDAEQSVNDKLVRMLFLIGALKDAGAVRVSAVVPYLCYARKDRRTKSRDPVSTRYVARLFESVGADRVMTLDVHNLAAYENAFRIPNEHLLARPLLVDALRTRLVADPITPVTVLSPDLGGIKRAESFREALEARIGRPVDNAFVEKYRSADVLSGGRLVGDVTGRQVVMLDDLIASGSTLVRAAQACRTAGAAAVFAVASHGAFAANAARVLAAANFAALIVTDTIDAARLGAVPAGLEVVSTAELFAGAIRAAHEGGSISALGDGL